MRKFLMTTTAAIVCMAPGAGLAQDAAATAQQPPAPTNGSGSSEGAADATTQTDVATGLQDIIVTAQRRAESAQKAAVAISVVGGADLVSSNISQPERLNQLVPALTIANVGPSATSFIRGVGNFSVSITSDPAVAFNYDGVYLGRFTATSTTFFDLDRVEVLKGPQGTLYGRNATAGAINILPTQPKIGQLGGYGTISYGKYDALSVEGAINIPLGDNGAMRVSGIVNRRDGYMSDGTSDDKSEGLRVQFKANLTPSLTARASIDYAHLGGLGAGLTYFNTYACAAATATTAGRTPHCVVTPTNIPRSDGNRSTRSQAFWQSLPATGVAGRFRDPFPPLFQDSDFFGWTGNVEWDTGAGVLTVIPAIRFDHVKNRNASGGFPIINDQRDVQYSTEARFAGKISMLDYTLGIFYYHEDARLRSGSVTFNRSINFAAPTNVDTESYAPFARLTLHLGDQLRLVGGVRYTHDAKKFFAHGITIAESCNAGFTCPNAILIPSVVYPTQLPFNYPTAESTSPLVPVVVPGPTPNTTLARTDVFFNNRLTTGKVTWRGAAEFDVAPASLLYASVETGFRSGGFSTGVGYETYRPEYITAYTIGSKNRFLDNRLQLNIEAFYWKYRDQQVAHAIPDRLGRPGSYTENIGRSTIKGFEVETRALVTPTTTISADFQYLDAENKFFTYRTLGYPYTNCAVATTASPAQFDVNCAGFPGYNSPKYSLNLAAEQTVPLGDYKLVFGADTQYKTGRYTYFDYATEQYQPKSWTSNAQVSFGRADGSWSLQGFVRNIENDRLLTAPVAVFGLLAGYTTPPRTYGVRASVKF